MRRKLFSHIAVMFTALLMVTSCLSNDDNGYTTYSDAAVTGFTLGKVNLYLHTTSSQGTDSVYKKTIEGNTYKFYIDQLSNTIYNPDSLPYGTDAKHMVVTVAARNGGVVALKSLTSDSLRYFSAGDSLDFSKPRQLYVYSNDMTNYQSYEVRVNVHQEEADNYNWTQLTTAGFTSTANGLRAVALGKKLVVIETNLPTDGNVSPAVYNTETNSWSTSPVTFGNKAGDNLVGNGEQAWTLDNGQLFCSTDGLTWENKNDATVGQLIGATHDKLYALSANGQLVASADEGATWENEPIDSDVTLLPTQSTAILTFSLKTNQQASRLVLIGNRSKTGYPADAYAHIWAKVEETAENSIAQSWFYYDLSEMGTKPLPWLSQLQVARLGNDIIAVGRTDAGQLSPLYFSEDNALSWHADKLLPLPDGFNPTQSFAMTVDADNLIWIIDGTTGKVWRGRYNKYTWEEYKG